MSSMNESSTMRPAGLALLLVVFVACNSPLSVARMVRTGCSLTTDCPAGETCQAGVCGVPPPSATDFIACELDADCPRGSYCSLGACSHQCLRDADCSGEYCSDRGRCATFQELVQPPPAVIAAPAAPSLVVSVQGLQFARGVFHMPLGLRSDGPPIQYRVFSNRPWLSVSPDSGTAARDPTTLDVAVDRVLLGGDTSGQIVVRSAGGTKTIPVAVAASLSGAYAGEVQISRPYAVGVSSLSMSLVEQDGAISGFVDPRSMLFPNKSAVAGTVLADGSVSLSFTLVGAPGSDANPRLPNAIRRTVALNGTVSGVRTISGNLIDTLHGPLEADIIRGGSFQLTRMGPPRSGSPDPAPIIADGPLVNPFSSLDLARCECAKGCDADGLLKSSADFYARFERAAAGEGSPFDVAVGGGIDVASLRCAQYKYFSALKAQPSTESAARFLDSLEILTDYALLAGNAKTVEAANAWKTSGSLAHELAPLQEGISLLGVATHAGATAPVAMLDPFVARNLLGLVGSEPLASSSSRLSELLDDPSPRAAFEYLRREILVINASELAHFELADRQSRLGRRSDALATSRRGAVSSYLDLVILGELLAKAKAPADIEEMNEVEKSFEKLAGKYEDLVEGRNPAGYSEAYVPFLLDPKQPTSNYQQVEAYAAGIYQSLAKTDQDAAAASGRDFEKSEQPLADQVLSQEQQYEAQFFSLCGSKTLEDCGQPGSQLAGAVAQVKVASLRIQEVDTQISNLWQEIEAEISRAHETSRIRTSEVCLINEDGIRESVLGQEAHDADDTSIALSGAADGLSAIGPLSIAASQVRTGGAAYANDRRALIAQAKSHLERMERATLKFDEGAIEVLNSAVVIKTKMLQQQTLRIERLIAGESFQEALDNVVGIRQRAELSAAQRARFDRLKTRNLRNMLQFRIYVDQLGLQAQESLSLLRKWTYLATRASEYELNSTYANRDDLWKARTADELNMYLHKLDSYYMLNRPLASQVNFDVLSVRDDLLDLSKSIKDGVSGEYVTPQERFRRYVADPAHRDENGNLRIRFSTYRPDKAFFSRSVCGDRIRSVRVNLIGDELGKGVTAYVLLSQGGVNYLRACGASDQLIGYDLSDNGAKMRVARVEAGVNAPVRLAAGQPSSDFVMRSVLSPEWELVIEQRALIEPQNAKLNLLGLDDIELIIEHDASTIQP